MWGTTVGWQVDGPTWSPPGQDEHQSANRWVRFHDPDVGRFYRDHLKEDVRSELEWYEAAGKEGRTDVYRVEAYQKWLESDHPHIMPSLLRLRSLLTDELPAGATLAGAVPSPSGWGAADIALGYSLLRLSTQRKYMRLIPKTLGRSPYVLGLHRRGPGAHTLQSDSVTLVQEFRGSGIEPEPRWHGWDMPRNPKGTPNGGHRSFGRIRGNFPGKVAGKTGSRWISHECQVAWADAVTPRELANGSGIRKAQENTPVAVIGPFLNANDSELTRVVYPPENEVDPEAEYQGASGPVRWQESRLRYGRLNLEEQLRRPDGEGAIAYAVQFVWSPRESGCYLSVEHQGGVAAWINSERVLRHHSTHRPGEEILLGLGRLNRGWNRILLKVESFTGDYTFSFRLMGLDRQPIPSLKFSSFPAQGA
jgi:hypothetical protein